MRIRYALGFSAAVGLASACATAPHPTSRPSLLEAATSALLYDSPARWRYHPRTAARQLVRIETPEGKLYAGDRGERWLASDRPQAAAQLAPEPLIAVSRTQTGWVFIGASGTTYEAEHP